MKHLGILLTAISLLGQGTAKPVPAKKTPAPGAPSVKAAAPPSASEPAKEQAVAPKTAAPQTAEAKPSKSETLRFTLNWPSGLSLGEGELTASLTNNEWRFSMKAEAAVPGFGISETADSKATADYCSTELRKKATRGKKVVDETTIFDTDALRATRETNKGGKTEFRIPGCAKDALSFLFFLRRELTVGRIPQAQPVYYGAAYNTRVVYAGTQTIRTDGEAVEADKLTATIKGPVAELTVDLFFARDSARTPLLAQFDILLGKFTVEFSR